MSKLLLFLISFLIACPVFPQTPGKWSKVQVCDFCEPSALLPASQGKVMVVTGSARIDYAHFSTDYGDTWKKANSRTPVHITPNIFQYWSAVADNQFFLRQGSGTLRTKDGGMTWQAYAGPVAAIAFQMHSPDSGMMLVGTSDANGKVIQGRFSTDSGTFFTESAFELPLNTGFNPSTGYIIDSDTMVALARSQSSTLIAVTTDRGKSWTIDSFSGTQSLRAWYSSISVALDTRNIYLLGGSENVPEFQISTDLGKSWTASSGIARGRVYRVVSAPSGLWKLVGQQPELTPANLWADARNGAAADSLYFSSNDGASWHLQEQFVGDTITGIERSADGDIYVMTRNRGAVYVWSLRPSGAVNTSQKFNVRNVQVHPNPSSAFVQFIVPFSGTATVQLIDVLGNVIHREERPILANVTERIEYPRKIASSRGSLYLLIECNGHRARQLILKSP